MRNILLTVACFITFTISGFARDSFEEENTRRAATDTSVEVTTTYLNPLSGNIFVKKPVRSTVLAEMKSYYPALYSQYRSGRNISRPGWVLLITGCVFYGTSILWYNYGGFVFDEVFGAMNMAIGTACLVTSTPFLIIGGIKKRSAIKAFNRQPYSSLQIPQFQLNVYSKSVGIAYVF